MLASLLCWRWASQIEKMFESGMVWMIVVGSYDFVGENHLHSVDAIIRMLALWASNIHSTCVHVRSFKSPSQNTKPDGIGGLGIFKKVCLIISVTKHHQNHIKVILFFKHISRSFHRSLGSGICCCMGTPHPSRSISVRASSTRKGEDCSRVVCCPTKSRQRLWRCPAFSVLSGKKLELPTAAPVSHVPGRTEWGRWWGDERWLWYNEVGRALRYPRSQQNFGCVQENIQRLYPKAPISFRTDLDAKGQKNPADCRLIRVHFYVRAACLHMNMICCAYISIYIYIYIWYINNTHLLSDMHSQSSWNYHVWGK